MATIASLLRERVSLQVSSVDRLAVRASLDVPVALAPLLLGPHSCPHAAQHSRAFAIEVRRVAGAEGKASGHVEPDFS
jgi:hypothetical protein